MPSRPVVLPTYTTGLPTPDAPDLTMSSVSINPKAMAFTKGLPL